MPAHLSHGTRFGGRYELVERLGGGTFGDVWRATDANLADRAVAVKFLKDEFLGHADVIARFDDEAMALIKLAHANVVQISDRGEHNGSRYLVMELVQGESLDVWLEAHRQAKALPDLGIVRQIFDEVCTGVEAAHDVRAPGAIVHRDLKPANVMLVSGKKRSRHAKVLDFGLARLGMRKRTQTGALMGTPLYMSPEQATGRARDVGTWSDVFSLGVILLEMLTLEQSAPNEQAWWEAALRAIDIRGAVRGLRSDVPEAVWDVIEKALRNDPVKRFAHAGELREALSAAWETTSASNLTHVPPDPDPRPIPKTRARGYRAFVIAGSVLAAAALMVVSIIPAIISHLRRSSTSASAAQTEAKPQEDSIERAAAKAIVTPPPSSETSPTKPVEPPLPPTVKPPTVKPPIVKPPVVKPFPVPPTPIGCAELRLALQTAQAARAECYEHESGKGDIAVEDCRSAARRAISEASRALTQQQCQ